MPWTRTAGPVMISSDMASAQVADPDVAGRARLGVAFRDAAGVQPCGEGLGDGSQPARGHHLGAGDGGGGERGAGGGVLDRPAGVVDHRDMPAGDAAVAERVDHVGESCAEVGGVVELTLDGALADPRGGGQLGDHGAGRQVGVPRLPGVQPRPLLLDERGRRGEGPDLPGREGRLIGAARDELVHQRRRSPPSSRARCAAESGDGSGIDDMCSLTEAGR